LAGFDTKSMAALLNEIPGDITVFKKAYTKNKTLAAAVRQYVNELFGQEGLVVVDADDRSLKKLFVPVIQDDLFHHHPKRLVEEKNKQLESLGYHTQVFARDINLFIWKTVCGAGLKRKTRPSKLLIQRLNSRRSKSKR